MTFDASSVRVEAIRESTHYGGLRARLTGQLGNARCAVQLDVGFGDAITPAPKRATCPVLLNGMPGPRLQVYPRATVVAEKLEAIVSLGMANSRMKDYYDLLMLARENAVGQEQLAAAIGATFERRATAIPDDAPLGLTMDFADDAAKLSQWRAFLRKNQLEAPPLAVVVEELRRWLAPRLVQAKRQAGMS